ncbi:MAG: hypothetical protein SGI97_05410 [candidate division Zixibacteria bacterium]|nr:hypothetical protein [candidate division Zixibacteria bacterium]
MPFVPKKKLPPAPAGRTIIWPFGKKNYIFFAIALVVIIAGFVTLSQGSMTLAPFLLVVGYCVLVPIAIMIKDRPSDRTSTDGDSTPTV